MKIKAFLFAIILILSTFIVACGNESNGEEIKNGTGTETVDENLAEVVEPLKIYTTIFPLEDFTNKIGGEYVNVMNVVPVGADAHTFEPTAKTMVEVAEADAFIYNGAGIEGFADALINSVENEKVEIVKASEGVAFTDYVHDDSHGEDENAHDDHAHEDDDHAHEDDDHGHEQDDEHSHKEDEHDDHEHGDLDPHVWLDPILAITLAENIKEVLVDLMPEAAEEFEANFIEVKEELEALDAEFQEMASEVSHDTFLVSHAAYGYWTERYGIKQIGISGLSPTNEPSQKQLQEIIKYAEEYGINYVFFEQNVSSKVAEVVKGEIGAEALRIHNLEAVTQEDIDNQEDYFSLMRKNIEALRTALQ
ncbi:metal ABC transporter substrate-binding protein [Anaerobacillus sp. MEB173]|uniref:metal ABC transporter substrate-binding protein n=1 Tax=Anaerobacillus sp. MEB173 TaxID=3383345 RepID=UPI003F904976